MTVRALIACVLACATPARAELGAMLGIRQVTLAGDVTGDATVSYAAAGIAMVDLGHGFAVGIEPGLRRSGSTSYRMFDLAVPLVGRYSRAVTGRHQVRASVAFAPALRVKAQHREAVEEGYAWENIDGVRGWDLDVVAGVGYAYETYFVEVRAATNLMTVDIDRMPLAIYRREVGIWIGFAR